MQSRILGNSCMMFQQGAYLLPLAKESSLGCQDSTYRANGQKLAGSYHFYPNLIKNELCSPHSLHPLPSWGMLLRGFCIFELYYQNFPQFIIKDPSTCEWHMKRMRKEWAGNANDLSEPEFRNKATALMHKEIGCFSQELTGFCWFSFFPFRIQAHSPSPLASKAPAAQTGGEEKGYSCWLFSGGGDQRSWPVFLHKLIPEAVLCLWFSVLNSRCLFLPNSFFFSSLWKTELERFDVLF